MNEINKSNSPCLFCFVFSSLFKTMIQSLFIAKIQDYSQYRQHFIDPVGNKSWKIRHTMIEWFSLSFIFLQFDWLLKQAFKSDWLFCFSVPFSLAGEMVRFGNKSLC